jgi:predicted house-cleaning noncanonical NTP pyrophosphatase (MazG superfamily)
VAVFLCRKEADALNFANEIILACEAGIKELDAIKDYTEKIRSSMSEDMRKLYTDNRMDELPHIQNIVVALTEMLNGDEPEQAARMDADEDDPENTDGEDGEDDG